MRPFALIAVGFAAVALANCSRQPAASDSAEVKRSGVRAQWNDPAALEAAATEVYRQYVAAAQSGDPTAMLALYSRQPSISSATLGTIRRGREAIRADLDSSAGPDRRFQITPGTADVTQLGDSVLLLVAPVTISAQTDTGPARVRGAVTLILGAEGGAWRIRHDHFSIQLPRR